MWLELMITGNRANLVYQNTTIKPLGPAEMAAKNEEMEKNIHFEFMLVETVFAMLRRLFLHEIPFLAENEINIDRDIG